MTIDRVTAAGLIVAAVLALTATLVGVNTGFGVQDVDEAVFRHTLQSMRAGEGYYPAMRDALIEKEKAPPDSVRAIRPPTLFLLLRWFPHRSWRWIVGLVYFGILIAAFQLGRMFGQHAALVTCGLAFLWVVTSARYLFLHSELWGAPLFMAGLLHLRREDDGRSAALLAAATFVRELFGVGVLLGLLFRRKRAWMIATASVIAGGVAHFLLARDVLSSRGHQIALGNETRTVSLVLSTLSPGDGVAAWVIGLALFIVGVAALVRYRSDASARLLLGFLVVLVPGAIIATRTYWSLTWGPALAAWVPGALTPPESGEGSHQNV